MIRLFVADIDGCLAEPFQPFDLPALAQLAESVRDAGPTHLAFSLLSGRAFPYVEAMSQLLGTRVPVVFESGGGVFDRKRGRVIWNPQFTDALALQIEEMRAWILGEVLPFGGLQYDYGKRTQAGVVGADRAAIERAADRIKRRVSDHYPDLVAYKTHVSVDVLPRVITKKQAIGWLSELARVPLDEIAYIGDTEGDLGALGMVQHAFCPANADDVVRREVDFVTSRPLTEGVLEAYRWCIAHNALISAA